MDRVKAALITLARIVERVKPRAMDINLIDGAARPVPLTIFGWIQLIRRRRNFYSRSSLGAGVPSPRSFSYFPKSVRGECARLLMKEFGL